MSNFLYLSTFIQRNIHLLQMYKSFAIETLKTIIWELKRHLKQSFWLAAASCIHPDVTFLYLLFLSNNAFFQLSSISWRIYSSWSLYFLLTEQETFSHPKKGCRVFTDDYCKALWLWPDVVPAVSVGEHRGTSADSRQRKPGDE